MPAPADLALMQETDMTTTAAVGTDSKALYATVAGNLKKEGGAEKTGAKVAGSLQSIENELLELYSQPESASNEKEIAALQIRYQRAQRVYELFTTLMKNAHDMMMSVIRNLRLG